MSKPIEIDRQQDQGVRAPAASGVTALAPPSGVKTASGLEQSRSSTGAKFTPGPWRLRIASNPDELSFMMCVDALEWGSLAQVVVDVDGEKSPHGEANANLIAASPELYEALSLYVAACGNTAASVDRELVQEAWRRASAALAKAQGK